MKIEGKHAPEFSFTKWYPKFAKNALDAEILRLPAEVVTYLNSGNFVLPLEATSTTSTASGWSDDSPQDSDEEAEPQPSFPEFSKRIQSVIDDFDAVFIKLNWSTPSDAVWIAPTKTLKCTTLEDIYLLLKSSDRISNDVDAACDSCAELIDPCLVLKRWRDIDPCTEYRCFVINKNLVGIAQRDTSQFFNHLDAEKYSIQQDITSLFTENIKNHFDMNDYTFDVTRYKKDKVKIVDFGPLNEITTKGSLFTLEELKSGILESPEFRFIGEDMGIQPKPLSHFCIPREINDFFRSTDRLSMMDAIRREVAEQQVSNDDVDSNLVDEQEESNQ